LGDLYPDGRGRADFVLLAMLPAHAGAGAIWWRIAVCGGGMGLFQQPNARAIVMAAPRGRSGGAGAIQGSARLLGQSIGAAMVALVFHASGAAHGAVVTLALAAGFAAVAMVVSTARQFDFAGRIAGAGSGGGAGRGSQRPIA
jgi:DHA2 family multidrug resistance protein-like MFS transporter